MVLGVMIMRQVGNKAQNCIQADTARLSGVCSAAVAVELKKQSKKQKPDEHLVMCACP